MFDGRFKNRLKEVRWSSWRIHLRETKSGI